MASPDGSNNSSRWTAIAELLLNRRVGFCTQLSKQKERAVSFQGLIENVFGEACGSIQSTRPPSSVARWQSASRLALRLLARLGKIGDSIPDDFEPRLTELVRMISKRIVSMLAIRQRPTD
jgi:hypothetical protein